MNIADSLRAELLNYELAIPLAESRIKYFGAVVERCRNGATRKVKRRFVYAKIARDSYERYRDDLLQAREALARGIDSCLGSYPAEYRNVFWEVLLKERSPAEAALFLGMSEEAVERIAAKLRSDLHRLYRQ